MTSPLPFGSGRLALRLKQPLDLLGVVPYLVGYNPTDCIVAVGLRDGAMLFIACVELRSDSLGPQSLDATLDLKLIDGIILVAYAEAEQFRPHLPALLLELEQEAIQVFDILRVHNGRFWSYACRDERCCPPEGTPFDIRNSRTAAEATLAGLTVLPDRAAFLAQVEPIGGAGREAMRAATLRARQRADALDPPTDATADRRFERAGRLALRSALAAVRSGDRLSDDDAAWLCLLVNEACVRDRAWALLGDTTEDQRVTWRLWLDLLQRAEPPYVAGPGVLFAVVAWRLGETMLARLALDRVLRADPGHGLARYLDNSVLRGERAIARLPSPQSTRDRPVTRRRRGSRQRKRSSSDRAESPPT